MQPADSGVGAGPGGGAVLHHRYPGEEEGCLPPDARPVCGGASPQLDRLLGAPVQPDLAQGESVSIFSNKNNNPLFITISIYYDTSS